MSFEIFWSKYPRKVAKRAAKAVFDRMSTEDKELAIKAIDTHLQHWKIEGTELAFIPHPTTWLRQGRFEDEIVIQVVKGKEWHETGPGITAKGLEFGLEPSQFQHFYQFKEAVFEVVRSGKVINVKFG
jgi:hypothetical protein